MNFSINQAIKTVTLSVLVLAPILSAISPASAHPRYRDRDYAQYPTETAPTPVLGTDASYLGAGISGGLTSGNSGQSTQSGGTLYGRYAIPQSKLSARAGVVFTDKISAVTPKLTYDIGVGSGTNIYVGGGYNFVNEQSNTTPLGDKSAPVLSLGAESQLANNVLIFGSADLGLNAYKNSNSPSIALQGGAGFRF
jgi:hypothetical protein